MQVAKHNFFTFPPTLGHILADIIVMVVISLIPLLWIPHGQILTGHDSGYPINVLESYKNRFFTWNSQDSMGLDNATSISVIPVLSIQAAASAMGASVADSEKITFVFWFFLMQAAMYMFTYSLRDVFGYRWFPLLAAVFYVFNFYLLALWRYGAGTTFSAYTALPLTLACTIGMLRGIMTPVRSALLMSLVLFFFNGGGGLSIPLFGGLLVSLGWALIYFIIVAGSEDRRVMLKNTAVFLIFTFVVSFLLNAYWLLPFIYFVVTNYYTELSAKGGKAVVLMWTHSVSIHTSISNLFRLQGFPDWYNNPSHPYANSFLLKAPLIFLSMLFAPAAYFSLLIVKRLEQKKLILYLVVLSLLGIFFAAGTHPPTGWLYSKLILHVPGFVVFRSAQYKFIPALLAAFAILISYSLNYLVYETKLLNIFTRRKSAAAAFFAAGFICLIALYHYPFFQRGFFFYNKNLSTLLSIPDYIHSFDQWSADHFDDEGRTLILPRFNSTWKAGLFDWNYFSLYSPFNLITPKPFIQYSYYLNEAQLALFNRLTLEITKPSPLSGRLLNFFQVRHFLLAKDINNTSEDMPSESWLKYENALENKLFPVVWNEGSWKVYQNTGYQRGKIYGVNTLTGFYGTGNGSIGAILGGADDFILPQILGKSTHNPDFSRLAVRDVIYGIKCSTCDIFRTDNEIIPAYTNILPGSLFYGFKRAREIKPVDMSSSLSSVITSRLGSTLKRIAEVASLADKGSDTETVKSAGKELYVLWKEISEVLPTRGVAPDEVDILARVNDYAASEDKALTKLLSARAQYINPLKPVSLQLKEVLARIHAYKQNYGNSHVFVPTAPVSNADFYLDYEDLAVDKNGNAIYPSAIEMSSITQNITPDFVDGRVMLGRYSVDAGVPIRLIYPEQGSLFDTPITTVASVDNIVQSCQVAQLNSYDYESSYEITLANASKMSKTAQIYLRKKKNYSADFSATDSIFKPDYAFNFDKENEELQRLYFTGADGDVEAYVYLCAAKDEQQPDFAAVLTVREVKKPTLFIQEGKPAADNRLGVPYQRINQTKYVIDLSDAVFPLTLIFNENYNTLWRLSDVDSTGNLWQVLTVWNIPSYAKESHMQVNGFANAWYIKEMPPGGELILEFYPQSLFYKGILVTVLGLTSVLIFFFIKRKSI